MSVFTGAEPGALIIIYPGRIVSLGARGCALQRQDRRLRPSTPCGDR